MVHEGIKQVESGSVQLPVKSSSVGTHSARNEPDREV